MISVIICLVCTLVNTIWAIYWINRLGTMKELTTKMNRMQMCRKSIINNVCPKCCEKCAWNVERY